MTDTPTTDVAVVDLRTGHRRTLVRGGSQPEYVASAGVVQTGFLVYAMADALHAIRFDPARLEVHGDPVAMNEPIVTKASGAANYAVSRTGSLVYVPAGTGGIQANHSLVWVDRKGGEQPINAPQQAMGQRGHAGRSPRDRLADHADEQR